MKTGRTLSLAGLLVCLLLLAPGFTYAEEPAQGGQSLEQAASDPTASLMSVQIQDVYAGSYHNLSDENGNTILLRSAVPFATGSLNHIARATLPIVVLFDLIVFKESWGRWGLGPVMLFPTATSSELGTEKWAIGPAAGFTARQDKLLWGLFNQNLFSFAGNSDREQISISILQPIVNYSLPDKWSIGTSEMNITYDWIKSDWTVLPLGVKVAKLVTFGDQPVQFSGAFEYNFADDAVAPKWTVSVALKFLFPL